MNLRDDMEVIDLATDKPVAYEVVGTTRTYQKIRFPAHDVPATGYKCYKLAHVRNAPRMSGIPPTGWGPWQSSGPDAQTAGHAAVGQEAVLKSPFYKVVLGSASGAVKSVFDKELNKELVDQSSPYRFDQYLYVTGANKVPNRVFMLSLGAKSKSC